MRSVSSLRLIGADIVEVSPTSIIPVDGETSTVEEQETIVFHRRGDGWTAVHEHLSPARAG